MFVDSQQGFSLLPETFSFYVNKPGWNFSLVGFSFGDWKGITLVTLFRGLVQWVRGTCVNVKSPAVTINFKNIISKYGSTYYAHLA